MTALKYGQEQDEGESERLAKTTAVKLQLFSILHLAEDAFL